MQSRFEDAPVTCLVPWRRGWPRRTSHKKVMPILFGERNCRQEAAERDNKASLGNPFKLTWRLFYCMSSTFSIGVKPIMWCFKYTYPPMSRWRTDRVALRTRTRPPRMRARPPTFSNATANSSGRPLPGVKRREPPGKPSSPSPQAHGFSLKVKGYNCWARVFPKRPKGNLLEILLGARTMEPCQIKNILMHENHFASSHNFYKQHLHWQVLADTPRRPGLRCTPLWTVCYSDLLILPTKHRHREEVWKTK